MKQDDFESSYPSCLDHKPGHLLGRFLYRLFRSIRLNETMTEELRRMRREGALVYAIKYGGCLEFLLYNYRFRASRVPYPKIAPGLNMALVLPLSTLIRVLRFYIATFFREARFPNPFRKGFYREAIQRGMPALIRLVDPKGFERQFLHAETRPLFILLETQKEMERPIFIVPQLILYRMAPERERAGFLDILFGFGENPGFMRKIGIFLRNRRKAFIDFGAPLNLKTYMREQAGGRSLEEMAADVEQTLIERIDLQKRVILGPIMKSRQQLKEIVLRDAEIRLFIDSRSGNSERRIKQERKKAAAYFDEIAADYNQTYVELFLVALTWLWKRIYQGIEVDGKGLARVRQMATQGPLIYIPSHKSHIDYLVLNYVLYQNSMHVPRIAAGKNLAFWPMGHMFRKSGAFFIRRSFKGAKLYALVFERYVKALLEEGHPLEFFIEGGRSRSGKLIMPKMGFLSILMNAQREGYCDDLTFIPASIAYDRILEEQSYIKELGGVEKRQEDFKQMLKARGLLSRKYGKIYIRFGEPLSLKAHLSRPKGPDTHPYRPLAFELIKAINRTNLVTPLALTATVILSRHRRGFEADEFMETAGILLDFLKKQEIPLAESLDRPEQALSETLAHLVQAKAVSRMEDVDGDDIFYYVEDEKKTELEYYKNSIIHAFISHGYAALSVLAGSEARRTEEELLSDYCFLKELFRREFVYERFEALEEELEDALSYFVSASLLVRSEDGKAFEATGLGLERLPIWAALVRTFLESYWVAARTLIRRQSKGPSKGGILKHMTYQAHRLHKLGLILHREAISQVNFRNAIQFMEEEVLKISGDGEKASPEALERLAHLSERIHELAQFRG